MINQSLGDKIRQLREAADISLRELARFLDVSAPFLSDVELGRRFPNEEMLKKISTKFNYPLEKLTALDFRESAAEIKRIVETNPTVGFAFRTVLDRVKEGKLTPAEIVQRLNTKPKK